MIKYSYDGEVKAAYILIADAAVADTLQIESSVFLDVSDDGQVVGIELLNLAAGTPPKVGEDALSQLRARGIPAEVIEFLGRGGSGAQTAQAQFFAPA